MKSAPHNRMLKIALTVFFLSIPFLSFASSYTVAPLVIDHDLKKRDIDTETITITNKDTRVIRIFPTVNEVSVSDGGTIQNFVEPSMIDNKETAITSWIEVPRGRIELKPGESTDVTMTIHVDPEVKPGDYHAFIGFPDGSNRPEAEQKVYNGQVPGTIVRIGVDTVQNQFLHLTKFAIDRFVKSAHEGAITFTLQNPGQDPVTPKGEIIFYSNNGNEVGSVTLNTEQTIVEAGKEVTFTSKVPDNLKMGKYKGYLTIEYGSSQTESLNDTAFFYVLPLKQLIIIFVVVLFAAILLALYVHKKYDMGRIDRDDADEVAMYIRQNRSESKDHDIDLSKKNTN